MRYRSVTTADLPGLMTSDDGRGRVVDLRQFAKDWAHATPEGRARMVAVPPRRFRWYHRFKARRRDLASIAAVAHALCDRDGVEVPDWVWRHRIRPRRFAGPARRPRHSRALWCAMALCVAAAACGWGKPPPESPAPETTAKARAAAAAVEVLAFGSLHGDGRSDPSPLAGVTIIAIPQGSWGAWWEAVGRDLEEDPVPHLYGGIGLHPGAQFQAEAHQILGVPGAVTSTTGADGTAQLRLDPGRRYRVCALSPDAPGLIAGCEYDFEPDIHNYNGGFLLRPNWKALMVYFSHGRAYIGAARHISDPTNPYFFSRAYWFQQIAEDVFDRDWTGPTFAANPPPRLQPPPGKANIDFYGLDGLDASREAMALIEDSQIGAWWDSFADGLIDSTTPVTLVRLNHDPTVYEGFLGTATIDVGAYLICWLARDVWRGTVGGGARAYLIDLCFYEEFPAGSHSYLHTYILDIQAAPRLRAHRGGPLSRDHPEILEIEHSLTNTQGHDPSK